MITMVPTFDLNKNVLLRWLPDKDSNLDSGLQRAVCYHYTIGHFGRAVPLPSGLPLRQGRLPFTAAKRMRKIELCKVEVKNLSKYERFPRFSFVWTFSPAWDILQNHGHDCVSRIDVIHLFYDLLDHAGYLMISGPAGLLFAVSTLSTLPKQR